MDLFKQPPPSDQNFFVQMIDESVTSNQVPTFLNQPHETLSMNQNESKKKKKRKQRTIKPQQYATGPTNREQFQHLFALVDQLQKKINQLEHENLNLKAIVGLSNICPNYQQQSIDQQQLPQLFEDKVQNFSKCMK